MKTSPFHFGYLIAGLSLLFLTGCGNRQAALDLNQQIAVANQRLAAVGTPLGVAIGPALAEQPVNIEEVRRTYKALQDEVTNLRADSQTWKVPSGASSKNFFDAHQRFLIMQQEGIDKYGDMVKIAENAKLSAREKKDKIQKILVEFDQKEKVALAELQQLQQVFAKDNNLRLEPAKK